MIVDIFLTILVHIITEQYGFFGGTFQQPDVSSNQMCPATRCVQQSVFSNQMCPIHGKFALYKPNLQDYIYPHAKVLIKNIFVPLRT